MALGTCSEATAELGGKLVLSAFLANFWLQDLISAVHGCAVRGLQAEDVLGVCEGDSSAVAAVCKASTHTATAYMSDKPCNLHACLRDHQARILVSLHHPCCRQC